MGDSLPEVDLGKGFFAVAVSAGYDHTCAIATGGKLKCWGDNAWGQVNVLLHSVICPVHVWSVVVVVLLATKCLFYFVLLSGLLANEGNPLGCTQDITACFSVFSHLWIANALAVVSRSRPVDGTDVFHVFLSKEVATKKRPKTEE